MTTADTITRNPGHTPVELAYGAGSVWVAYADRVRDGFSVGVLQLDPETLRVERASRRLGTISRGAATFASLAAGDGAVDIDERASQWSREGWSGFDARAASHAPSSSAAGVGEAGQVMPVVQEELQVGKRAVSKAACA